MTLFSSFQENYDDPYLFNNPNSTPFLNDSKYYDLPPLLFSYNSENNIDSNFSSFLSPGIHSNLLRSPINEYNTINYFDDKDLENNIKGIPFKSNIPIEVKTVAAETQMPVNPEISNTTSKIFEIKK